MREKLLWATMVILGVVFATSRAQSPAPQPANPGRFQLFIGPNPQLHGTNQATVLYRINTATGDTWAQELIDDSQPPQPALAYQPAWVFVIETRPVK
jgi:hypothetical protein